MTTPISGFAKVAGAASLPGGISVAADARIDLTGTLAFVDDQGKPITNGARLTLHGTLDVSIQNADAGGTGHLQFALVVTTQLAADGQGLNVSVSPTLFNLGVRNLVIDVPPYIKLTAGSVDVFLTHAADAPAVQLHQVTIEIPRLAPWRGSVEQVNVFETTDPQTLQVKGHLDLVGLSISGSASIGTKPKVLDFSNLTVTFNMRVDYDLDANGNYANLQVSRINHLPPIHVSADTATLFPQQSYGFTATVGGVIGDFNFLTGELAMSGAHFEADIGPAGKTMLQVTGAGMSFHFTPDFDADTPAARSAEIASADHLDVAFPQLTIPQNSVVNVSSSQPLGFTLDHVHLRRNGFSLGDGSNHPVDVRFNNLIDIIGLTATIHNLNFTFSDDLSAGDFSAGGLTLAGNSAQVLQNVGNITAKIEDGLQIDVGLKTGEVTATGQKFTAALHDILTITGAPLNEKPAVRFDYNPAAADSADLLTFGQLKAQLDALKQGAQTPTITLGGFGLKQNGHWFLSSATVDLPDPQGTFPLAAFLPVRLVNMAINFPNPDDFNAFTITTHVAIQLDKIKEAFHLPAVPVITVGNSDPNSLDLEVDVAALKAGAFRVKNFGPITITLTNFTFPFNDPSPVATVNGQITFGNFDDQGRLIDLPGHSGQQAFGTLDVHVAATGTDLHLAVSGAMALGAHDSRGQLYHQLLVHTIGAVDQQTQQVQFVATTSLNLDIIARPTDQAPFLDISVTPTLGDLTIQKLRIDLSPVAVLTAGRIDVFASPAAGEAKAVMHAVAAKFPQFQNLSGSIQKIELFEDAGNPGHGTVKFDGAELDLPSWSVGTDPAQPVATLSNVAVTFPGMVVTYDVNSQGDFTFTPDLNSGHIHVHAAAASIFPNGSSHFDALDVDADFQVLAHSDGTPASAGLELNVGDAKLVVAEDGKTQALVTPHGLTLHLASDQDPALRSAGAGTEFASAQTATVSFPQLTLANDNTPLGIEINDLKLWRDGFTLGGVQNAAPVDIRFGTLVDIERVTATASNLGFTFESETGNLLFDAGASLSLHAASAKFFSGSQPGGVAGGTNITATLDRSGLTWTADMVTAKVASLLQVTLIHPQLNFTDDETKPLVHAPTATASLPELGGVKATLQNVELDRHGEFFLTGFALDQHDLAKKLGLADFLPVDIKHADIQFTDADLNHNGRRDPGEHLDLSNFDITVTGNVNFELLRKLNLPFTPIFSIGIPQGTTGMQTVTAASSTDTFSFRLTVHDGKLEPKDVGPITFGFKDLKRGPVTLGGTLTLGGYVDGQFSNHFGGSFDVRVEDENNNVHVTAALSDQSSLVLGSDSATLNLVGGVTVSFSLGSHAIDVQNAALHFDMGLTASGALGFSDGSFDAADAALSLTVDHAHLNGLSVQKVTVKAGDELTAQATLAAFNFDAGPNDPFVTFGGQPGQRGALTLQFGDVANPDSNALAGLGGSMGNLGVGFDLSDPNSPRVRFYQLRNFFVIVSVPPDFKFGLPDWVPITVREVGLVFHQTLGLSTGVTEILDMAKVSIIFSGGLQGSPDGWPITAQVEGLEVNLDELARGDFPIDNIGSVHGGVEPFEIPGTSITVGGILGFGVTEVDSDADPMKAHKVKVLFGRVLGQLTYEDFGGGIEIILTQYGPILARLLAGVPIPIGAIVGGLIGSVVPGTGTAAGAELGEDTGFFITGLEGGLVFGGGRLPTVTDPIQILTNPQIHFPLSITSDTIHDTVQKTVQKQPKDPHLPPVLTFTDGVTFVGSGVLTNINLNGYISGRLTLSANLGLNLPLGGARSNTGDNGGPGGGSPVGFQLIGIGDLLVFGMPLASVGILFDFKDPLNPVLDAAYRVPGTTNSLIALVLPAEGDFGVRLDSKGLSAGGVVALRAALEQIIADTGADQNSAVSFFHKAFDLVVAKLAANRQSRLAQLILDNGDGVLTADELNQPITPDMVIARLRNLLNVDISQTATSDLQRAASTASALTTQLLEEGQAVLHDPNLGQFNLDPGQADKYLDLLLNSLQPKASDDPDFAAALRQDLEANRDAARVTAALARLLGHAAATAGETFLDTIDPSLTIESALQPTILGIPLGKPSSRGSVELNKHHLLITFDTTAVSYFGAGYAAVVLDELGGVDVPLGFTIELPFGDAIKDLLLHLSGQEFKIDPVDPAWGVEIRGGITVGQFQTLSLKGLVFPPPTGLVAPGTVSSFIQQSIQKLYEEPADTLVDPNRAPVRTLTRFNTLTRDGGILLNGLLQVPRLITDPVKQLAMLHLQPPSSPLEYPAWIEGIVNTLTAIDQPAQIQMFIPSVLPELVTNFTTYQDSFDRVHYADQVRTGVAAEDAVLKVGTTALEILRRDGYVEGTWGGKLFGVPVGQGLVEVKPNGIQVTATDPFFGLDLQYTLKYRDVQIQQADGTSQTVKFPYASGSVDVGSDKVQAFLQRLGVPAEITAALPAAHATLTAYSPGFASNDAETADPLKRVGGFRLSAHSDLGDLDFQFALPSDLTQIPDFTGTVNINHLSLPGLAVTNAKLTIKQANCQTSFHIDGAVLLLGQAIIVAGDLNADRTVFNFSTNLQILGFGLTSGFALQLADSAGHRKGELTVNGYITTPGWLSRAASFPGVTIANANGAFDNTGALNLDLQFLKAFEFGPAGQKISIQGPKTETGRRDPAIFKLHLQNLATGLSASLEVHGVLVFPDVTRLQDLAVDGNLSATGSGDSARAGGSLSVSFGGNGLNLGGFVLSNKATFPNGHFVSSGATLTFDSGNASIIESFSIAVDALLGVGSGPLSRWLLFAASVSGSIDQNGVQKLAVEGSPNLQPLALTNTVLSLRRHINDYLLHLETQASLANVFNGVALTGDFDSSGFGTLSLNVREFSLYGFPVQDASAAIIRSDRGLELGIGGSVSLLGQTLTVDGKSRLALRNDGLQGNLTLGLQSKSFTLPSNAPIAILGSPPLPDWQVTGTLTLALGGGTAGMTVDGTIAVPGLVKQVHVNGALDKDGLGALALAIDSYHLGGSTSATTLSGSFALTRESVSLGLHGLSSIVTRLKVTQASLDVAGLTLDNIGTIAIDSLGGFDAVIPARTVETSLVVPEPNGLALTPATIPTQIVTTAPSALHVHPDTKQLQLHLAPATVRFTGLLPHVLEIPVPGTDISIQSGDFSLALNAGLSQLDLLALRIKGDFFLERSGGSFRLGVRGSPSVEVPGLFQFNIQPFAIDQDGTFTASPRFLVQLFGLSPGPWNLQQTSVTLRSQSHVGVKLFGQPLNTLEVFLEMSGNTLVVPAAPSPLPVPIPNIHLYADGAIDGIQADGSESHSLGLSSFPIGQFATTAATTFTAAVHNGAIQWQLLEPAHLNVLGNTLTLEQLSADSSGNISDTVSGNLNLRDPVTGKTYSLSGRLSGTGNGNLLRLTLEAPFQLDLGFAKVNVNGYVQSDGAFSFTGSTGGLHATLSDQGFSFTTDNQGPVSLAALQGTLSDVNSLPLPSIPLPNGVSLPLGFFGFHVDGVGNSGRTTVVLPLPRGASFSHYEKFGHEKLLTNPFTGKSFPDEPHWYNFDYDAKSGTGAEFNSAFPGLVILHFVDGQRGDNDVTPNGTIDDPGGPAVDSVTSFVTGLYRDVLGRTPDSGGLTGWVGALRNGATRLRVSRGFWESPEHRGLQVDQFYATYLRRAADPGGRLGWVNDLLAGIPEAKVERGFVTSPEYAARHSDVPSFVQGLYADVLGRAPDTTGRSVWEQQLYQGGDRDQVARAFLSSSEAFLLAIDHYYSDFLQRFADEAGRNSSLGFLEQRLSPDPLVEALLASDEYFARPSTLAR